MSHMNWKDDRIWWIFGYLMGILLCCHPGLTPEPFEMASGPPFTCTPVYKLISWTWRDGQWFVRYVSHFRSSESSTHHLRYRHRPIAARSHHEIEPTLFACHWAEVQQTACEKDPVQHTSDLRWQASPSQICTLAWPQLQKPLQLQHSSSPQKQSLNEPCSLQDANSQAISCYDHETRTEWIGWSVKGTCADLTEHQPLSGELLWIAKSQFAALLPARF